MDQNHLPFEPDKPFLDTDLSNSLKPYGGIERRQKYRSNNP